MNGSLTLNGLPVLANQQISISAINNGDLVFMPTQSSGSTTGSAGFVVHDNGGTLNGGQDIDQVANQLTFNVANVNLPPAASDNTIAIDEDGSHTFTTADFGFSDPVDQNNLQEVLISSVALTNSGSLTLNNICLLYTSDAADE